MMAQVAIIDLERNWIPCVLFFSLISQSSQRTELSRSTEQSRELRYVEYPRLVQRANKTIDRHGAKQTLTGKSFAISPTHRRFVALTEAAAARGL